MTAVYTQTSNRQMTLKWTTLEQPLYENNVLTLSYFWYRKIMVYTQQTSPVLQTSVRNPSRIYFYVNKSQISLNLKTVKYIRINFNPLLDKMLKMFTATFYKTDLLRIWFFAFNYHYALSKTVQPTSKWNPTGTNKYNQPIILAFKHL